MVATCRAVGCQRQGVGGERREGGHGAEPTCAHDHGDRRRCPGEQAEEEGAGHVHQKGSTVAPWPVIGGYEADGSAHAGQPDEGDGGQHVALTIRAPAVRPMTAAARPPTTEHRT